MDPLRIVYLILVHALAVPTTLFPILYGLRSDWTATREGVAQFISGLTFAVFVDYVILNYWFRFFDDDSPAGQIVACVIILGLVTARTYLLVLLRRAQRLDRQERR